MSDRDTYPSPREALFGNGHVANLYCAVKWMLWHLFHVLFMVFGAAMVAVVVPMLVCWRGLVYAANRLASAAGQENPAVSGARTALSLVREKPVTRRIYNECPVDIKANPRWFDRVAGIGFRLVKWAENETVWYCDVCGVWYRYKPDGGHTYCDGEFLEVRRGEVGVEGDRDW